MSKSTLDKSLLDVISDPDGKRLTDALCRGPNDSGSFALCSPGGTTEDKMRLFLIYYITAQQPPSEVTDHRDQLWWLLRQQLPITNTLLIAPPRGAQHLGRAGEPEP